MSQEQPRSVNLSRRGRWRTALLAVGAVLALGQCYGLREDELRCEEAVAHLIDCCPGFDRASVSCLYTTTCGVRYPELTIEESRCVAGAKCADILAGAICDRVAKKSGRGGPSVCP